MDSLIDIFDKAKFSASLLAVSKKAFRGYLFSLVILNWKDVIGSW